MDGFHFTVEEQDAGGKLLIVRPSELLHHQIGPSADGLFELVPAINL